eukprot:CAMPEP_0176431258 /NCGR_PEP_ID=MMETSP0127-20121128/14717_1 /TAXON_ID=938130 /ORGANISM="Platyophrya macrostoma, Strain WH" /LENGTH=379 /DNA_ID=CAMNT_0017813255 /DNA_START=48 /DNA_END=1187 /DNA_ORIENTATION=+
MTSAISSNTICIIDPLNRTGKVAVPFTYVQETKGFEEYRTATSGGTRDFSLCLLFHRGRCNAGARCHQIHVAPSFTDEVRQRAMSTRTCCAAHGEVHSSKYMQRGDITVTVSKPTGSASSYALGQFALTAGLEAMLEGGAGTRHLRYKTKVVRVPASRLCRLHLEKRCKFGRDCKHVHLCPDASSFSGVADVRQPPHHAAPVTQSHSSCMALATPPPKSIDEVSILPSAEWSCGVSTRSGSTSEMSSHTDTPREHATWASRLSCATATVPPAAPVSIDDMGEGRGLKWEDEVEEEPVKPLMTWGLCCAPGAMCKPAVTAAVPFGEEPWSLSETTAALDLSAFETTIRSLCEDLDRAAFSPNCAERVRSQSRFFADLLVA